MNKAIYYLFKVDRALNKHNAIIYTALWGSITVALALITALAVTGVSDNYSLFEVPNKEDFDTSSFIFATVIGPILETLVLIFIAVAGYEMTGKKYKGILISALTLSFVHGFFFLEWGVIAFPGFFIYSFVYFLNRNREFAKTKMILIHSFHNLYIFAIAWVVISFG